VLQSLAISLLKNWTG